MSGFLVLVSVCMICVGPERQLAAGHTDRAAVPVGAVGAVGNGESVGSRGASVLVAVVRPEQSTQPPRQGARWQNQFCVSI